VYSKSEAETIASSCHEPVPDTETTSTDPTQPIRIATPDHQEKEYSPDVFQESDTHTGNGMDAMQ
jgi:hypothetical protein